MSPRTIVTAVGIHPGKEVIATQAITFLSLTGFLCLSPRRVPVLAKRERARRRLLVPLSLFAAEEPVSKPLSS